MSYQTKYEAEYECDFGHRFTADSNPFKTDNEVICSVCYQAWLDKFPRARQKTSSFEKAEEIWRL